MAGIVVYSGLPGAGKTYEVVENVIASNLAYGRRVVTNVAGLDIDAIELFCGLSSDKPFGELVTVSNEDVGEKGFFPTENPDDPSIVRGGDVVVLDEVWRWYATGVALLDEHMVFLRMHRHFTDPVSGFTCDVALIVQSVDDLQRKVRHVVEKVFVCKKHKELGFTSRYLLLVYAGNRTTKNALSVSYQRKYRREVFKLYQSHSQKVEGGKGAIERDADGRGSIFGGMVWKLGIPLCIVFAIFGYLGVKKFFSADAHVTAKDKAKGEEQLLQVKGAGASSLASSSAASLYSQKWRVVGSYSLANRGVVYVLSDGLRLRHLVDPPAAKFSLDGVEVLLPEGGFVSAWSGAEKQTNFLTNK